MLSLSIYSFSSFCDSKEYIIRKFSVSSIDLVSTIKDSQMILFKVILFAQENSKSESRLLSVLQFIN